MKVAFLHSGIAGLHAATLACHGIRTGGLEPMLVVCSETSGSADHMSRAAAPFRFAMLERGEILDALVETDFRRSRPLLAVLPDDDGEDEALGSRTLLLRPQSPNRQVAGQDCRWRMEGCTSDLALVSPYVKYDRSHSPEGGRRGWERLAVSMAAHLFAASEVGPRNMTDLTLGDLIADQSNERAFIRRTLRTLASRFDLCIDPHRAPAPERGRPGRHRLGNEPTRERARPRDVAPSLAARP